MKDLPPACCAPVMATGIISIAARDLELSALAQALFVCNVVAFAALAVLTAGRLPRYPRLLFTGLTDHRRGPGFFTAAAASSIPGTQVLLIARDWPQPSRPELNFFALSMWLRDGTSCIWIISLIFYRYNLFAFSPGDLTPPYWITIGAMAISTLAGARLIENVPDAPFLASLLPFLKGFTVFYWATGTWWIPMLLVLGVWRHIIERFPLRYDPRYWGAVFPLGMYTVATREMAHALELSFLAPLLVAAFAAALAASSPTFFASHSTSQAVPGGQKPGRGRRIKD